MENDKIFFQETQRFKTWWLWILFLICAAGVVYAYFIREAPLDDNDSLGVWMAFVLSASLVWLFTAMRLTTEIRSDGIYVKYAPFNKGFRKYAWQGLETVRVRKYSALFEYGGWGLRGFGNNRALNVSGNMGIQLSTKRGKKLLIGTRKPEEVKAAIAALFP